MLPDVFVRKVKILRKPTWELGKLRELHGEGRSYGKATGGEISAWKELMEMSPQSKKIQTFNGNKEANFLDQVCEGAWQPCWTRCDVPFSPGLVV